MPKAQAADSRSHADAMLVLQSVRKACQWIEPVMWEMGRAIVGQEGIAKRLLIALLSNGHVLVEGAPGQGKRLIVKTLVAATQATLNCIELTPDLQPEDILGSGVPGEFGPEGSARLGPVFAHLVLAEEVDRAPGRVQCALLEAMRERQVVVADRIWRLPQPFLVVATQSGTGDGHRLSRAQTDRFMLKLRLQRPSWQEERQILDRMEAADASSEPNPVACVEDVLLAQKAIRTIYVDESIKDYMMDLVWATRHPEAYGLELGGSIRHGGSLRATLSLEAAARAMALLNGRWYVSMEDVSTVAKDVLRHRVVLTHEARAQGLESERVIEMIMEAVREA